MPQAKTLQDMQLLAKERGGICVSKKYVNGDTKLEWACAHGHRWKVAPKFIAGGTWCPTCSRTRTRHTSPESIGQRVQFIRLEKKLHQEQIADEAGIAQTVISRLEAGLNVSTTHLVQIAIVLNIRTEWLENGEGDPAVKSLNLSADELALVDKLNRLSAERKKDFLNWLDSTNVEPFSEHDPLFATRLKNRRRDLGLTQVEVADKTAIKQANLSALEAGKKSATRSIVALAEALSVTPEWLVLGYGDPLLKSVNVSKVTQQFIHRYRRLNNKKKKEAVKKLG